MIAGLKSEKGTWIEFHLNFLSSLSKAVSPLFLENFLYVLYFESSPLSLDSMKNLPLLLALFLFSLNLFLSPLYCQNHQFQRYYAKDGLSTNQIRCLLEDQQGFIWIGTSDGLNRFDGYEFRVFKPNARQPGSISSNNVYHLDQDAKGRIWIATLRGGVNYYDPRTERFTVFRHDPEDSTSISSDEVIAVHVDTKQRLWIGTREGLDRLVETDSGAYFVRYNVRLALGESTDRRRSIHSLFEDEAGYLWIGAAYGLSRINPETGHIVNYNRMPEINEHLRNGVVHDAQWLADGSLYLGTTDQGLFHFAFPEGLAGDSVAVKVSRIMEKSEPLTTITGLKVMDEQLWVGTNNGLYLFPRLPHLDSVWVPQVYLPVEGDPNSISWKGLMKIISDRSGSLWIGSADGLNHLPTGRQAFHYWGAEEDDPRQLSMGYVGGITVLPNGDRWINTIMSLEFWDESKQQYTRRFRYNTPRGLPNARVIKHIVSRDGSVWVATYDGLCRLNDDETFSVFRAQPVYTLPPFGTGRILDLREDHTGKIWISSYHGLLRFDPQREEFDVFQFSESNNFTQMVEEENGNILVGSQLGLFRLNPNDSTYTHLPLPDSTDDALKGEVIKSLLLARDQSLWIGGREALYHWQPQKRQLTQYLESDGLANAVVTAILEDEQGCIWFSHNKGISYVDPARGEIRNFDESDGLGGAAFRSRAAFVGADGTFYFCGNHGVSYFHPNEIGKNDYLPPLVLTDFQLFNRSVPIASDPQQLSRDSFQLSSAITLSEQLTLSHDDQVFSIGFSGLNYYQAHKNQYAFRLVGYDKDWRYVNAGRRFVTYTNLNPGTYTFEAKASNNDGVWNETPRQLALIVTPPWWQTWWAYLFYLVLVVAAIYGLVRLRTQKVRRELQTQARIEKAKVEEREQVRARSSRDFHDEAGNKITKISLYTGLLKTQTQGQPQIHDILDKVEKNVQELGRGMRDFIWVLDPKKDNLRDTLERIRDFGQQLYADTGVDFRFQQKLNSQSEFKLDLNLRRHLLMICKEALHNALKYAQASQVVLKATIQDQTLEVAIRDNGMGFDVAELSQTGNGIRNMQSRAEECGAEVQIEGLPGIGTRVVFRKELTQFHPNG
jgi:ligand-binding sensor domain-containing protein/signal transduction histidine kinase